MNLKTVEESYNKGDMPSPHIAVNTETAYSGYFATVWVWTVVDCSRNEDGTPMADDGYGFWEPEDSSEYRFPTREGALDDALTMAVALEIPFWEDDKEVYVPPEPTQEELEAETQHMEEFVQRCKEADAKRNQEDYDIPF